jgi:DNA-binding NtrC family response regulator
MTTPAPVYVVDDDASVRDAVGRLVRSAGWKVETFASAQAFLASRWADVPSCLILDVQLPGLSGLDLQQRLASSGARTSIIFLTGHGDIPTSVRAIKAGALEFLTKPYADADLIAAIEQGLAAAERRQTDARGRTDRLDARIQSVAGGRDGGRPAIGQSAEWKDVLRKATQVASTESTVLLQGESGTGKEVVARFIHRASPRKHGPFVAINCAALPEHLLESELFGYERGAFTGAQQAKAGQIELASAGVLFLDEVSEMSPMAQAKLLRVLQEREFLRLGGTRPVKANVRVIAASNRDLQKAVADGRFREDLFYRLQVFDIRMPPLRERPWRHPPAGRRIPAGIEPIDGIFVGGSDARRAGDVGGLRVAWQRPGASQRARARGHLMSGWAHHGGSSLPSLHERRGAAAAAEPV